MIPAPVRMGLADVSRKGERELMIRELNTKTTVGSIFIYVLVYASWIVTTLLGLATVFYTRQVLNMTWRTMWLHTGLEPAIVTTRVHFYDLVESLILLLLWAFFAFVAEHRYRSSVVAAKRRHDKEEKARSRQATASQDEPREGLREWGIDILTRRFLIMTSIPVILFVISYLVGQISFQSLL
jgi:hypothetical protein